MLASHGFGGAPSIGDAGPVAIGGVGGSGTRVAAQILRDLGFYLGECVNEALDNLWFTLLFKRPAWFLKFPDDAEVSHASTLFRRAMTEGLRDRITQDEKGYIMAVAAEAKDSGLPLGVTSQDVELLIGSAAPIGTTYTGWAWKEPNTHVFLRQLCRDISDIKYIHVMRHGLDMAFSGNLQQTRNWGPGFGIEREGIDNPTPPDALDYWIAANVSAIRTGSVLLGERFFLLDFDALCAEPLHVIDRLCHFLKVRTSPEQRLRLAALPRTPPSTGRFRACGTSRFSGEQLSAVRRLGYPTD